MMTTITLQRMLLKFISAMTFMLASVGNSFTDQPITAFIENLVIDLKLHAVDSFNQNKSLFY